MVRDLHIFLRQVDCLRQVDLACTFLLGRTRGVRRMQLTDKRSCVIASGEYPIFSVALGRVERRRERS